MAVFLLANWLKFFSAVSKSWVTVCSRDSRKIRSRRADEVLTRLRAMEGTVALFSHGQFLRVLAVRWIGLPVREAQHLALDTASVSILGHNGEIPVLALWNTGADAGFPILPREGRP